MRTLLVVVLLSLSYLPASAQVVPPSEAQTLRHQLFYDEDATGDQQRTAVPRGAHIVTMAGAATAGAAIGTGIMLGAVASVKESMDGLERNCRGGSDCDDEHYAAYVGYATVVLPWIGGAVGVLYGSGDDLVRRPGPFAAVSTSSLAGSLLGVGAAAIFFDGNPWANYAGFAFGAGLGAVGGYYAVRHEAQTGSRGLIDVDDGRLSLGGPIGWLTNSLQSGRVKLVTVRL